MGCSDPSVEALIREAIGGKVTATEVIFEWIEGKPRQAKGKGGERRRPADHSRLKVADVIDRALLVYAKQEGFSEPAPRR